MSDEEDLGEEYDTFWVPRKRLILVIVFFTFLYGVYNGWYMLLDAYMAIFNGAEKRECYGPGCYAAFTCEGTIDSSYHFRWVSLGIGSLVFSIIAMDSVYNKYPVEMFQFAGFMFFAAVVHASTFGLDLYYTYMCNNCYPYNIISEMVLWPVGGFPFGYATQHEVRQLDKYPARYIDKLCFTNVRLRYCIWTIAKVIFCLYVMWQAIVLALRFHYGLAGMGATFSISKWQERLKLKYEINDVAYNTFGMAVATGMDLGWTEDEYRLQRPLRQPFNGFRSGMYGGRMMPGVAMPAAAATAYDGFRDDRRNVLL